MTGGAYTAIKPAFITGIYCHITSAVQNMTAKPPFSAGQAYRVHGIQDSDLENPWHFVMNLQLKNEFIRIT
ncbi:hypothetical protein NO263_03805 [Gluconacetobacter entanii]|uniref:Uncharacterized protein n=1 Tax=Gluconacetobacter entanii TaxID=108528 RepID=A0ABT3K3D3_9PROT|nr:hypothetical protein [Gluconacetobacter entanii]MCW4589701.1 hypothetical protein [Gluconacetobacter entanii]MCW4593516.1 hypothetical protein [Gluconacetobacter entanii]NPC90414.1 hypothetical protein [Gluconacetobacter entanii]